MQRETDSSKNKKYLYISIIFIIITIVSGGFGVKIYREYKQQKELEEIHNRNQFRRVSLKKENGWYYFLEEQKTEIVEGEPKYVYVFGGCNIKYEKLEDNYTPVYDIDGTFLYGASMIPPSLSSSHHSVDGTKEEGDEVHEISRFLNKEQFNRKITVEDLQEVSFSNFHPEDIVTLWNTLQEDEAKKFGPYIDLNLCNFKKEKKENQYFQVGVLLDFGYLEDVEIDYVDQSGQYLTDKITNHTANEEEKKMYQFFEEIENYIVEKQTFNVANHFDDLLHEKQYEPLLQMLNDYESVKKES